MSNSFQLTSVSNLEKVSEIIHQYIIYNFRILDIKMSYVNFLITIKFITNENEAFPAQLEKKHILQ